MHCYLNSHYYDKYLIVQCSVTLLVSSAFFTMYPSVECRVCHYDQAEECRILGIGFLEDI